MGAWEGAADAFLDAYGPGGAHQDAFALAAAAGCETRPWGRSWAMLEPGVIWYPSRARPTRQHGLVAHELGHEALRRAGEDHRDEQGATYVGGALMLPRRAFDRDVRAAAWDLEELRRRHPNCPASMVARRLVQARDAVATILDGGKVKERVASPWAAPPGRLTAWERELADAALETGRAQRDELATALPVFDGPHRRVVLVVERRQLSLRL